MGITAGILAFSKVLAKKESMKGFADGLHATAESAQNAGKSLGVAQVVQRIAALLDPWVVPLQALVDQIISETTEESMNLMLSLMELLQHESTQRNIARLTDALNEILKLMGVIAEKMADHMSALEVARAQWRVILYLIDKKLGTNFVTNDAAANDAKDAEEDEDLWTKIGKFFMWGPTGGPP